MQMLKVNVLIVEGESETARDLEERLKRAGFGVAGRAENSTEAVQIANEEQPEVVLMGLHLKDEADPLAAATTIQSECNVPVLFLSANGSYESLAERRAEGVIELVRYPIQDDELQEAVERVVAATLKEDTPIEGDPQRQTILHFAPQGRYQMFKGLVQASRRWYETLDLECLLSNLCEQVADKLGVKAACVMLYDQYEQVLKLSASYGLAEEFELEHKPMPVADFETLLKQVSPVAILLTGNDEPYLTNANLYRSAGIRTAMLAEMRQKERLVGCLCAFKVDQERYFAYEDLGRLQGLADLAVQPIANAVDFAENQQLVEQLELSCDAGIVLNNILETHLQVESLLQIVREKMHADRAAFYRFQEVEEPAGLVLAGTGQSGRLVFESGSGYPEEALNELADSQVRMGDEENLIGWVATNLVPKYVPDGSMESLQVENSEGMRCAYAIPVEQHNYLAGVLVVMSAQPYAFNTLQQQLLRRLANQSAVAVKNAQQLSEARKAYSTSEAKNRILEVLLQGADLGELTLAFLNELLDVLGLPLGALWLLDPVEDVMVPVAVRGIQSSGRKIPKEQNLPWMVYQLQRPYHVEEFRSEPLCCDGLEEMIPAESGGVLYPLMDGSEFVGVCLVGTYQPGKITAEQLLLLEEVLPAASSAIRRSKEIEDTRRHLFQARGLKAIDQAISASMDLRFILKVVLDQVIDLLQIDAADVLLLNTHTQTLEFAAGQGFYTAALRHTHLRLGQGYAGKAALERRMLIVRDLEEEGSDFNRAPLFSNEKFQTYYALPLVSKGQVLGVLELFARQSHESNLEWRNLFESVATQAAIAIDNIRLVEKLQRSNAELMLAYDTTLEGWSRALVLHDNTAEENASRMADMATRLAREMGVSDQEEIHIRRGALLHDIGKMGVPEEILNKQGPLSDEEWEVMRRHPLFAYDLLAPIPYLRPALDIPYCHHERWDGSGYPVGLKGDQIPLAARIFAVVDVWDSLLSDRPYRTAWPENEVLSYIQDQAGTHFDPQAVTTFMKIVEKDQVNLE